MRSHTLEPINRAFIDQTVTLCGWVHRRRDHGGVIFIDLRDRYSLVQVVFNPEHQAMFDMAQTLRHEFVVQVTGTVRPRPEGTTNPDLNSGDVEVVAESLTILNTAGQLPFTLDEHQSVGEEVRLKHRYLDLRRPVMAERMKLRSRVSAFLRHYLEEKNFLDIETPYLTKSTPEGARDYIVPSRVHPGQFYALPQSPQIFKQLLMVAGFDRYYQIVRCFRDEDLRADRQPEFTQLDIECSFVTEEDIMQLMEEMIRRCFQKILNVSLPDSFPRITYAECLQRFGNDRPDCRIPFELTELTDLAKQVDFKVFRAAADNPHGRVAALCVPGAGDLSRKAIDDYTQFVANFGAKGLAYIKVNTRADGRDGCQSPILKFLPDDMLEHTLSRCDAKDGDIIFFGADNAKVVNEALGALRVKLGHDLNCLVGDWRPLWVTDFPMFEKNNDGHWQALHHPFTAPTENNPDALTQNPGNSLSRAYDMVINGYEIGGGSIRIHDYNLQKAAFSVLGIDEHEAQDKFQHLLNGLQSGCPPHGGMAFGLDRLVMLMAGCQSIRDVITFPKTQTAHCPLTRAPSPVSDTQLRDTGIRLRKKPTADDATNHD